MRNLILAVFLAMFFAGCATVPQASSELDMQAKSFVQNPDKATIYIYRNEAFGGLFRMTVNMDGKHLGETAPFTFFKVEVDPGIHKIISFAETNAEINILVKAGKNYFVRQEVKMGIMSPRSTLYEVGPIQGMAGVKECKLIAGR